MAHPDHDQIIGRLAGARLRGAADPRALSGGAAEVHPDAEAWAAYLDGGLPADEVERLETHLAGCPACRRLLAVLAPEVSSAGGPAVREVELPDPGRGVVIAFPRRQVFAWMAAAAGLLMAVTLWSVSRVGDRPASSVAMSTPRTGAAAFEEGPPARQEQDKRKADLGSDAMASTQPAELAAAEAKQTAQVPGAAGGSARDIQLQTDTAAAGSRQRGPMANQQASQPAGTQQDFARAGPQPPRANSPPPPAAVASATPTPANAPAAEPVAPPAQGDAAAATRERRTNEQSTGQLAETVTIPSAGAGALRASAPAQPERSQAAAATREDQALSKDEANKPAAFAYVATASAGSEFAEPAGRVRWRIVDGRRLDASSDGGATWQDQYTARGDRLRAGTAPSADSAWAVGERGLVLRFAPAGGWSAVSRAGEATLIAVTATGARSARVTAVDGRVLETADGGATWTPVTPGADPR